MSPFFSVVIDPILLNLHVMRTCIISWTSLNFCPILIIIIIIIIIKINTLFYEGHKISTKLISLEALKIEPRTTELSALESLKNTPIAL